MAADKAVIHFQLFYSFMDRSFYTSGICDDAAVVNDSFQVFQIFYVIFNRGAQKNIVADFITFVFLFQYTVNDTAV